MWVLVRILLTIAILIWAFLLFLVGLGFCRVNNSRIESNYPTRGRANLWAVILSLLTLVTGIALLLATLGWALLADLTESIIAFALLLLGIQFGAGYARFERNLNLTMPKWRKSDKGLLSRVVGAVLAIVAIGLLFGFNLLGSELTADIIAGAISVPATLFLGIIVNILTGKFGQMHARLRRLIIWGTAFVVLALLFVETPLFEQILGSPAPTPDPTLAPLPTSPPAQTLSTPRVTVTAGAGGATPWVEFDLASVDEAKLREAMHSAYDRPAFEILCQDLGINYDDVRGDTLETKMMYLIEHFQRIREYEGLVQKVLTDHPYLADELR